MIQLLIQLLEMSGLPREVNKWLQSFNLSRTVRRPKWDFANGYLVAEILSWYHPDEVMLSIYKTGDSVADKFYNWWTNRGVFRCICLTVPEELVYGTSHCKDGAAILLVRLLYERLTGRQLSAMPAIHEHDFTDHAYQIQLPLHARATASRAVKNNIRFSEIRETDSPDLIRRKAEMILRRHIGDVMRQRRDDPLRYQRKPTLGERARRVPPPVKDVPCRSDDELDVAAVGGPFNKAKCLRENSGCVPRRIVSNVENLRENHEVCGRQQTRPTVPLRVQSSNPYQTQRVLESCQPCCSRRICGDVKDVRGVFLDDGRAVEITSPLKGEQSRVQMERRRLPGRDQDARKSQPMFPVKEVNVIQMVYPREIDCMNRWCR